MDNYSVFNRVETLRYIPRKAVLRYHPSTSLSEEENKAFAHLLEICTFEATLVNESYNSEGNLIPTLIRCHANERYGKTILNFLKRVAPKLTKDGFELSFIEPDPTYNAAVDGHFFQNVHIASFNSQPIIRNVTDSVDTAVNYTTTFELSYEKSLNSYQCQDTLNRDMVIMFPKTNPVAEPITKVKSKTAKKTTVRKSAPLKVPKKAK